MKLAFVFLIFIHLSCQSQNITSRKLRDRMWVTYVSDQEADSVFIRDTLRLTKSWSMVPFKTSDNQQFYFREKDEFTLVYQPVRSLLANGVKACSMKNECGKWAFNKKKKQITFYRILVDSNTTDDISAWVIKSECVYSVIQQTDQIILLVKAPPNKSIRFE
jgi:hypothetical protein